jgi:integrase
MATTRKRVRNGRQTWEVRWYDPDRRLRGKTFKRKVDAERFRASVEVDKLAGTYADPAAGKTPLAAWAQQWQATTVHLRPSTRARDAMLLERFILPRFGRRQLAAIGQLDVRAWVADLTAQGLAPATVAKCYQTLGKIMAAAVDAGLLARSPCRAIKLPKVEREEMRFLDPAEVARLADAIDPRYRALVLLGAYGGLRIGELAGLQRRRVHLLRGTVEVAEIAVEVSGQLHVGPPKTRASRRTVGLPRLVVAELDRHLAAYVAPEPAALVFTAPQGGPLRLSTFRSRFWRPAIAAAGLDGLRIHDLRHTAVALWIAAGASPKEVAARAGHTSVKTVLDVYGGLYPEADTALRERLNGMLEAATQPPPEGKLLELPPGASGPKVVPKG